MSARRRRVTEETFRVFAGGDNRNLHLIYDSLLSYDQLEEYADFMISEKLVYVDGGSGLYRLTPKGEALLGREELAEAPIIRK